MFNLNSRTITINDIFINFMLLNLMHFLMFNFCETNCSQFQNLYFFITTFVNVTIYVKNPVIYDRFTIYRSLKTIVSW